MPPASEIHTAQKARLIVFSEDHLPVARVSSFLEAIDSAYVSLSDLHASLSSESTVISERSTRPKYYPLLVGKPINVSGFDSILELSRVHMNSPGIWEFLGKLNPLEVIRLALNDAHERRKDRSYRESAEADALRLNNLLSRVKLVKEYAELLKQMGASDKEIRQIMQIWIEKPLSALDSASLFFSKDVQLDQGTE